MSILSFENSYMWKWMSKVRCVSKNQDKHLNSAVYFIFKERFCCCNLLTCYWISAEYKPKAAACLTTPCLLLIHIFTLKSWSYWDQQKRNRLFFIWDRTLQQWEQMNRNIIRMKPEPINNHKQSSFLFNRRKRSSSAAGSKYCAGLWSRSSWSTPDQSNRINNRTNNKQEPKPKVEKSEKNVQQNQEGNQKTEKSWWRFWD